MNRIIIIIFLFAFIQSQLLGRDTRVDDDDDHEPEPVSLEKCELINNKCIGTNLAADFVL